MANDRQRQGDQGMERASSTGTGERGGAMQRGMGGGAVGSLRGGVLSPFALMRRMMEDMDRMFADFGGGGSALSSGGSERGFGTLQRGFTPDVEVFEREGKLVVRADLPGMKENDVHVSIEDDGLLLTGERRHEAERQEGGVYHSERSYGSFQRLVPLPRGVDASTCDATFADGVLEVTLKLPERGGKRIPIRASGRQEGARPAERQPQPREPRGDQERERENGTQAPPARH